MANALAAKERIAASPRPGLIAWRFREMLAWDPDNHRVWELSIDGMTPTEVANYLVENTALDQLEEVLAELAAEGLLPVLH